MHLNIAYIVTCVKCIYFDIAGSITFVCLYPFKTTIKFATLFVILP